MEETNEKKRGIPLAHVALTLYSVGLAHFLTTLIFHFSVDNLIDALVRLVLGTGTTTVLVLIVVIVRERRKKRSAEA
ncbi:hypothetical protein [Streptomyces sp. NBC_00459]|uniref:hypothetical protein n=1 Tax=Streptomyces sp. NBC_00459 TaxID=2975749 RepID=UPI002E183F86